MALTRAAAAAAALLAACGGQSLPDGDAPTADPGTCAACPGGGNGGGGGAVTLGDPVWPPLQAALEDVRITFPPSSAEIVLEPWSDVYAPGRISIGGAWHEIELRQRGQGSRLFPKHSWKTRHPKGEAHGGAPGTGAWRARTRHFLSEWNDGGYLADAVAYALLEGAGVRAPRWRYVALHVNGEREGVYVELQDVDREFLRDRGLDGDANVYRCGRNDCQLSLWPASSYMEPWEKQTNEREGWDDLHAFLRGLNRTPEHELEAWLERNLDLERFVRAYAVGIVVSWSRFDDTGTYLVHDRAAGRWTFVPWDLNNANLVFWREEDPAQDATVRTAIPFYTLYDPFTIPWAAGKTERYGVPVHPPYVVLFQRAWDLPAVRGRILDAVEALLDGPFSEAQAFPRIDALRALLEPHLPGDPWISAPHQARAAEHMKRYVAGRAAFLRAGLDAERRRGEGGLVIGAIGPGFVELHNRTETARDLRGLALTDDLRDRLRFPLRAGTVVAPWSVVAVPFTPGADGGEVGLFDVATGLPLDVHFHAPLAGRTYARIPAGAETWGWR